MYFSQSTFSFRHANCRHLTMHVSNEQHEYINSNINLGCSVGFFYLFEYTTSVPKNVAIKIFIAALIKG